MFNQLPKNEDLLVFDRVVRQGSFLEAAVDLGVSPAYVSKRIRALESQLGTQLLHRTTRSVQLTEEGERIYRWSLRILDDVDEMLPEIHGGRVEPKGSLRVCSSLGFGRACVAPALSALTEAQPHLQFRLELLDRVVDVAAEGYDLDIRIGNEIAPHLIARKLLDNHRVLCAAPRYVSEHGLPTSLEELSECNCLIIKERDHPFGVWRLTNGQVEVSRKVSGTLSTNDGDTALKWAQEGRGILLRSVWQVGQMIKEGRMIHVLPEWQQSANIWAVYPMRLERSAKLRVTVEFLSQWLSSGVTESVG